MPAAVPALAISPAFSQPADMPRHTLVQRPEDVTNSQPGDKKMDRASQREAERQLLFQNEVNDALDIPNGYSNVAVLVVRWDESIDDFTGHSEEVYTIRSAKLK